MVKMLLLVVVGVVMVVVRWQLLRQVQGLMVCPPLESTSHTHNEVVLWGPVDLLLFLLQIVAAFLTSSAEDL